MKEVQNKDGFPVSKDVSIYFGEPGGFGGSISNHLMGWSDEQHGYIVLLRDLAYCLSVHPTFIRNVLRDQTMTKGVEWVDSFMTDYENGHQYKALTPAGLKLFLSLLPNDHHYFDCIRQACRNLESMFNEKGGSHE